MKPTRLQNKVCLVTGAAGIIGSTLVPELLMQGATVIAVDSNDKALNTLYHSLNDVPQLHIYALDITDRDSLVKLKKIMDDASWQLDVLVNNAATKSENFFAPFCDFPMTDWQAVMAVNLDAAMQCCQIFGQDMADRGYGSIINVLSIYGITAPDQRIYDGAVYEGRPINTPAVYSVSKAALWGLTQYLASYWGDQGVRVNAISPGGIFSGQNKCFIDNYSKRIPLGRMGEKSELMGAFVYLASDESSYTTGQNMVIDGGLTCW